MIWRVSNYKILLHKGQSYTKGEIFTVISNSRYKKNEKSVLFATMYAKGGGNWGKLGSLGRREGGFLSLVFTPKLPTTHIAVPKLKSSPYNCSIW